MATVNSREKWCLLLANACSPSFLKPALQALQAMLPMLDDFPDCYFTTAAARDIACADRKQIIPSLAEIRAVFAENRRAGIPRIERAKPAQAANDYEPPTPEQREASMMLARQVIAELRAQNAPR